MPHRFPTRLKLRILITLVFVSVANVKSASAAVLFEGWSKVLISGKHVGYVVQRYDFDEKKKEFKATHFLKTNPASGGLTESLAARADAAFKPISYQYTNIVGEKPTLIDATFKGDQMSALMTEGTGKSAEKKTIKNKLPKGTFLSAFLGYVMLQGKEGLKKGVKYEYQGVLEESALITKGEAYIAEEEVVSGIPVFRVLNTINGAKFISLATHKAEILGTVSPSAGLQTVLVATMEEAVAGFGVNNQALTRLFGAVPKGQENEIARRATLPKAASPAATKAAPTTGTITSPATTPVTTDSPTPAGK